MSAALLAYLAARKRNNRERKKQQTNAIIDALKDDEDREEERLAAEHVRDQNAAKNIARTASLRQRREVESFGQRWRRRTFTLLDQTWLQGLQYIMMIIFFQSLAGYIRIDSEFYMDKHIASRFIEAPFDGKNRRFGQIASVADVWEWGRNVLEPALFHNAASGETWPDGNGPFSLANATPMTISDYIDEANAIRVEHLVIKQVRMTRETGRACYAGHKCLRELGQANDKGDTAPYGHGNATGKFTWWTRAELGCDPDGVFSASSLTAGITSIRSYSPSGFIAAWLPFFSDTLLPDEDGHTHNITDFRPHEALPTNSRPVRYQCARSSINGRDAVQRCDHSPAASSGVIRQQFRNLLDDLRKGRFVDRQTGVLSFSVLVRNDNVGVRFYCRYLLEFLPTGSVIPSFDVETLLVDDDTRQARLFWLKACLAICCWFILLEVVELMQSNAFAYFSNGWNVMDWLNFSIFFVVYAFVSEEEAAFDRDASGESCTSTLCTSFGILDPWEVFKAARNAKLFLSLCVCIQLLKIIKFTNVLVPKMSLMTRVLSKGAADLVLFAVILFMAWFAFANLFSLQLGHAMDDFTTVQLSILSMVRALFGDFNFTEIVDNSPGSIINPCLFLIYLFVSVFILLALFLSILGESQAAVRDDENYEKAASLEVGEEPENEYGVIGHVGSAISLLVSKFMQLVHRSLGAKDVEMEEDHIKNTNDQFSDQQRSDLKNLRSFKPKLMKALDVHFGALESQWATQIALIRSKRKERLEAERERKAEQEQKYKRHAETSARRAKGTGHVAAGLASATDVPRRRRRPRDHSKSTTNLLLGLAS